MSSPNDTVEASTHSDHNATLKSTLAGLGNMAEGTSTKTEDPRASNGEVSSQTVAPALQPADTSSNDTGDPLIEGRDAAGSPETPKNAVSQPSEDTEQAGPASQFPDLSNKPELTMESPGTNCKTEEAQDVSATEQTRRQIKPIVEAHGSLKPPMSPVQEATSETPASNFRAPERSPTRSDAGFDDKAASEDERGEKSEIQSIMDQFSEEGGGPGEEEVMSPRLEFAGPLLGAVVQHPPRKSSLEPLSKQMSNTTQTLEELRVSAGSPSSVHRGEKGPQVPPKPASIQKFNPVRDRERSIGSVDGPISPTAASIHRPPPPEPEPDLPFDFHRFLEQLRHRTADPVAKFLRSFLSEFGKKQWMVHEQVKIISDFLAFITNKMAQCEVWREVSDAEFDNAREGMEKLVMNRLYTQTFSPAIPPPQPVPGGKSKRRATERPVGPGRRGQHQEDVERDDILAQKIGIYGWIEEQHLDIEPVGASGRQFLVLAQQELLKIRTYRAPRDKIICVLNCCKVIFGLLKHAKTDSSADSFMPLLIYVVLHANPEHLVSNVQYILRFRNQEKLGGEAGYYLSSLMGAVQFIENLDRTTLTISDEEFERHVEAAVSAIAEKHQKAEVKSEAQAQEFSEKTPYPVRTTTEGESSIPRPSTSSNEDDTSMTGLFKTIQRPLSSIGRIFSEDSSSTGPASTPRMSPAPRSSSDRGPQDFPRPRGRREAEDAAARQANAESAEAQRLQHAEHANVVETLAGMFPDLDRDIISDVVVQKNGRFVILPKTCRT